MTTSTADEVVIRAVVDDWKDAVDRHDPERVAACFTEDAVFQGLHPYTVGRAGIAEYYDSQPIGMTAAYRILQTRRLAADIVLGYLDVDFSFTDRPPLNVKLSVVLQRADDQWAIRHYQVSYLG
jgi:uncharacterized protein (TIGR02246 family)